MPPKNIGFMRNFLFVIKCLADDRKAVKMLEYSIMGAMIAAMLVFAFGPLVKTAGSAFDAPVGVPVGPLDHALLQIRLAIESVTQG